ncbi:KAP family P-loop NTPase fold protein [Paraburkholderia terricola]|uniref:KAP family P-loop NTPase fold protein n=1 Tax=Paraburkholderia terricola TaxID=169427 RepID=UPI003F508760
MVGRHRVSSSVKENASFVLNLNAEWGLGKTYFLKEWAKMLRAEGHPVVYFDAWANDYAPNPFVGFMVQIQKELTSKLDGGARVKAKVRTMVARGKAVVKAAAPAIAISLVKHYTGVETDKITQTVKDASGDVLDELKRDLFKETEDLHATIEAFKKSLRDVTQAVFESKSHKLPIFLLIDELDRCRPIYAIELLENIKHIFRVENVYTIVATDSKQLAHSIKAIYGEGFESDKYLRRFFDHESRLQTPNFEDIAQYMLDSRDLARDDAFVNPLMLLLKENAHSKVLSQMARALKLSVRDFERVIDIIDSIRLTYPERLEVILIGFFTMIYVAHAEAYAAFKEAPSSTALRNALKGRADFSINFPYQQALDISSFPSFRENQIPWFDFVGNYIDIVRNDDPQRMAASDQNSTLRDLERALRQNPPHLKSRREYVDLVAVAGSFSA